MACFVEIHSKAFFGNRTSGIIQEATTTNSACIPAGGTHPTCGHLTSKSCGAVINTKRPGRVAWPLMS